MNEARLVSLAVAIYMARRFRPSQCYFPMRLFCLGMAANFRHVFPICLNHRAMQAIGAARQVRWDA